MPTVPSKSLLVADYTYTLPNDRIAVRPVTERDASRLLVARIPSEIGQLPIEQPLIEHRTFRDLPAFLPEHSLVVVNTSKVFRARVPMVKATGGTAEVLLISPIAPFPIAPSIAAPYQGANECLASREGSTWECLIGGRHIHTSSVLASVDGTLTATVVERHGTEGVVKLQWNSSETLGDVLERIGQLPLPPYLGREAEDDDTLRYQTVYADIHGSAAAPTAGLHFTEAVFASLKSKHIEHIDLSLHVGLGTFKPIEVDDARNHIMHTERIAIHRNAIELYVRHATSPQPFVTVVGTTSLRALESVYWFGVHMLKRGVDSHSARGEEGVTDFHVGQWAAFQDADNSRATHTSTLPSRAKAFAAVLQWMNDNDIDILSGSTSIMLAPGCHIATADALVTNFHQPGNSLLLLVAAFCGCDDWKKVYDTALAEGYRFLSYGDSSLLIRPNAKVSNPDFNRPNVRDRRL